MNIKESNQIIGWKEEHKAGKVFFVVALLVYTGIMLYLFLMQCFEVPVFRSDMPDYVKEVAGIKGDYEFPYPLFFVTAKILALVTGAPVAVAVVTALFNSLAVCVSRYYMHREVRAFVAYGQLSDRKRMAVDVAVTVAVFVLFLLSHLYSPKQTSFFGYNYVYRCMGIYTPNPFWNATYMATRPFAIICFFEAARILREYEEDFSWKKCIPFAGSLLLTTLTKPSYTLVVLSLMAVILLFQLIRSRGRSFRNAFCLCVTMIPTGIALLYQYSGVFMGTNVMGEETGIGIAFAKVWSNFAANIPMSILMGMALPIGVLVLNYREFLKNSLYRFAWWNYLTGMILFLVLYEKGFRMTHANFSWGYMHGMFCVFFLTLILVFKNTIQWWKSYKLVFVIAEWAVLLYHLVCGINFLVYALQGKDWAGF